VTVKLGWARSAAGEIVHITQVLRGKACGCVCPDCQGALLARQGKKTTWHFAHSADTTCQGESAIHLAAKAQLVKAAALGLPILLPKSGGEITRRDIALVEHSEKWVNEKAKYLANGAREEVRLPFGNIADVVLSGEDERDLAVEVFVTHKKSPEDRKKYKKGEFDAIEIDVSSLPWNADPKTVLAQVTSNAPRTWIYSSDNRMLKGSATRALEARVENINESLQAEIRNLVIKSVIPRLEKRAGIEWPEIKRWAEGKDSLGKKVVSNHKEIPVLTAIGKNIQPAGECWITTGVVNSKTKVDVLFCPREIDISKYLPEGPTLCVECYFRDGNYGWLFERDWLEWRNINSWESKVEARAKKNLEQEIIRLDKRDRNLAVYAEKFRSLPNKEKLQVLAKDLGLNPPLSVGNIHAGWNAPWSVWKALVWRYKIRGKEGKKIQVGRVAMDDWLGALTYFPSGLDMEEERCKSLWFWFLELESLDILYHTGNQWFEISDELPRDFIPWRRISTD